MAIRTDEAKAFTTVQATNAATLASKLAAPASLLLAAQHQAASSVTILKDVQFPELSPENQCECCRFPYTGAGSTRFRMCAKDKLAELGLGFPLFFLVTKCMMGMLFVLLCVASIPNLVQNLNADRQEEWGAKSQIAGTSVGGNGDHDSDLDYWPVILNAIALFLLCMLYVFLWFFVRKRAAKLNENMNTPSDYGLVFKSIGKDWTEAELKSHIEAKMTIYGTPAAIKEISISYGTKKYINKLQELTKLSIRHERIASQGKGGLPEERACRCCCCCLSHKETMTEESYQGKLAICKDQLSELSKFVPKTGIAFVSLNTQQQVSDFLHRWKGRGIKKYFSCCQDKTGKMFKGRTLKVKRAPEPTDIIWENLVYSRINRILRTFVTTVLLAVILCCSFFILYGLAEWQKDLYDNMAVSDRESTTGEKKSSIEFSSIPPAIIIYVFNIVLDRTVRVMATFEHRHTFTDTLLSTSWKLTIVMSLNTILFPLLTHRYSSEWYTPGGLANNIFWVALSASFVKPFFKLFGPMFLWKLYRRWDLTRSIDKRSAFISQGKANLIFQNPEADVAAWYADIMIKFLLCLAYTPLLPLIVPIILLGFGLEYWIDKWLLLRRSCRPRLLNEKIAFSMIDFVKPALVLYGISILNFFQNINSDTRAVGIVSLIFAGGFWLCHSVVFRLFCKAGKNIDRSKEDYSSAASKFFTVIPIQTYKSANPFTRFEGLSSHDDTTTKPIDSDFLAINYFSNYMGLLSSAHTPIYSNYAYRPTAPPIDQDEDFVQVPKGAPDPFLQYSALPNRN